MVNHSFPNVEQLAAIAATPALVVNLPTVIRNIDRLAMYAAAHRIKVRPHTKTHKSLRMARLQLEHGAAGLTAAKAGEAVAMAAVSRDLLVAYPAVDPRRAQMLAELGRNASIAVALDGVEGARVLSAAAVAAGSTLRVLVDLDIGFHRTGTPSPQASLSLARELGALKGLQLAGLFFYPGHIWSAPQEQQKELARIDAVLAEAIELWRDADLPVEIVSGGSTPTAYQSHLIPHLTEIRPGTYLYNDMNTARANFCAIDDCAARILCTVVSDAVPGKVVIDAGTKTLTSDRNATRPDSGFGHVAEYPNAVVVRLSEEHGELDMAASAQRPRVGERVTIIPNHICPCVNLRDDFWLHDNGTLEQVRIDTRGQLS